MNFFEHQARARRRTSLLVAYFIAAVLAIVAAVSGVFFMTLWWASDGSFTLNDWWRSEFFAGTVGITLLIILAGSLHKLWQLRGGGTALAHMLGAREVTPEADGEDERRFRNVVEEMAIASGIPAPRTFVMDREPAINAFVAGFRPTEAVVVITEGTLKDLNRDELQGVIAHEFSHIFNADMNLNMRLMAVLSGILTIGRLGEFLLRSMSYRGRRRYRSSSGGDARGHAFLLALGLALMVIGYVGLFFGRLIKAAISRQRELLADASSVQFTRNPSGIAGALIKIRNGMGAQLGTVHAEDMSHMCFGQAVHYRLQGMLATHPPVDERLKAIGPEWVARARVRRKAGGETADAQPQPSAGGPAAPPGSAAFSGGDTAHPAAPAIPAEPTPASAKVGAVSAEQVGYAVSLLGAIPEGVRKAVRSPRPAQLMMFAMAMVSHPQELAPDTITTLRLAPRELDLLAHMREQVNTLGTRLRLPLIDLALPALKQLDQAQRDHFVQQMEALVMADQKLTLFEYVLTRILADHLRAKAERHLRVRFRRYSQVENDIQLVFSVLVHASGSRDEEAASLFGRMTAVLLPKGRTLLPLSHCGMNRLDKSLANLRGLSPLLKGPLVDAMADLVLDDGKVQVAEAELMRAVCTLLDCPVPPLAGAA